MVEIAGKFFSKVPNVENQKFQSFHCGKSVKPPSMQNEVGQLLPKRVSELMWRTTTNRIKDDKENEQSDANEMIDFWRQGKENNMTSVTLQFRKELPPMYHRRTGLYQQAVLSTIN